MARTSTILQSTSYFWKSSTRRFSLI